MNTITILALGAIAAFLVFVVAIAIYRASLADISVDGLRSSYAPGDKLTGLLVITAKRDLKLSDLTVALTCVDTAEREDALPEVEVYRDSVLLTSAASLHAKDHWTAEFSFDVPFDLTAPGLSFVDGGAIERLLRPVAAKGISRRAMDFRWFISVSADTANIELSKRVPVSVALTP